MSAQAARRPRKRLTNPKVDRALAAIVDLIECEDFPRIALVDLDRAADTIRTLRPS